MLTCFRSTSPLLITPRLILPPRLFHSAQLTSLHLISPLLPSARVTLPYRINLPSPQLISPHLASPHCSDLHIIHFVPCRLASPPLSWPPRLTSPHPAQLRLFGSAQLTSLHLKSPLSLSARITSTYRINSPAPQLISPHLAPPRRNAPMCL